jgi:hypothetical protein
MSNTLQLQQFTVPDGAPIQGRHTWPLKVVATSTIPGLPSEIFVYQAGQGKDPHTGDKYKCVASVHQLSELGTTPVVIDNLVQKPFFRRCELLFHCHNAEEAATLWNKIQADAQDLVSNFNAFQLLTVENTVQLS